MDTTWVKVGDADEEKILKQAGDILKNGGLVAFPTETVYGLGGDAFNPDSSRKIYAAKGRPSDNPLIVHICRMEDLGSVASGIPEQAKLLAKAFWPGPLTMILKKQPDLPKETTGGLDTVAVRFPNHPLALKLINAAGGFVAAPSANTSGRPSPTMGKYVYEDLAGRIDMLLDDGQASLGLESTIVDLTGDVPMILRPGFITPGMLQKILPDAILDPALAGAVQPQQEPKENTLLSPKAPGMKYKHYAPKGEVIIYNGTAENVSKRILSELRRDRKEGRKSGVIITDEMLSLLKTETGNPFADSVKRLGESDDVEAMAHTLFRFLREFDDEGIERIYVRAVSETELGLAVMNRLKKAAGGRILDADKPI